jgi:hypothetical protein
MKQTLLDYGVVLEKVPLLCDNESAVKIANNPVQHSRTKHIDICHHFLRVTPSAPLLPSLGEQLLLPLSSLSISLASEATSSTPLCSFKIPVNSSEIKWSYVFLYVP